MFFENGTICFAVCKSGDTAAVHGSVTGIPVERIFIVCTYSHYSPPFSSSLIHSMVKDSP